MHVLIKRVKKKGQWVLKPFKKSMSVGAKKSHLLIIPLTDFSDIMTPSKIIHCRLSVLLLIINSYINACNDIFSK